MVTRRENKIFPGIQFLNSGKCNLYFEKVWSQNLSPVLELQNVKSYAAKKTLKVAVGK